MIIKRLTLNNFGIFAGKNTFEFSGKHPIVLIGGMNGRGKTTFLNAVLLALYGDNSSDYRSSTSKYKTYAQYLRAYSNHAHPNETTYVEIEFEDTDEEKSTYVVRREWQGFAWKVSENLHVTLNGEYSNFLSTNWPMVVESILPSALCEFYFFDGEKIGNLSIEETDLSMKHSIQSMLGITVLNVLKRDMIRLSRGYGEKSEENNMEQIKALQDNKDRLKKCLDVLDSQIEKQTDIVNHFLIQIESLKSQYEIQGGLVQEKREALLEKKYSLENEKKRISEQFQEMAAGQLPLMMVEDLLCQIQNKAEKEKKSKNAQILVNTLEAFMVDYQNSNDGLAKSTAVGNRKEIEKYQNLFLQFVMDKAEIDKEPEIYHLSDRAFEQVRMLNDGKLRHENQQAKKLLHRDKKLQTELNKIMDELSISVSTDNLNQIKEQSNELQRMLVEAKARLAVLESQKKDTLSTHQTAVKEYNLALQIELRKTETAQINQRKTKYSYIALQILEKYQVELQKRKVMNLSQTATDCYKRLANKKNLIDRIYIDPETLDISYLDADQNRVEKSSLSAGESQLLVIVILWSLAICSRKKLPVIIDTPLSRLDSFHRESLVTTYFPNASDQTIILSTDSEIDKNYYEMMKENLGDAFTLVYDEQTKATTIKKGYFFEHDQADSTLEGGERPSDSTQIKDWD